MDGKLYEILISLMVTPEALLVNLPEVLWRFFMSYYFLIAYVYA